MLDYSLISLRTFPLLFQLLFVQVMLNVNCIKSVIDHFHLYWLTCLRILVIYYELVIIRKVLHAEKSHYITLDYFRSALEGSKWVNCFLLLLIIKLILSNEACRLTMSSLSIHIACGTY